MFLPFADSTKYEETAIAINSINSILCWAIFSNMKHFFVRWSHQRQWFIRRPNTSFISVENSWFFIDFDYFHSDNLIVIFVTSIFETESKNKWHFTLKCQVSKSYFYDVCSHFQCQTNDIFSKQNNYNISLEFCVLTNFSRMTWSKCLWINSFEVHNVFRHDRFMWPRKGDKVLCGRASSLSGRLGILCEKNLNILCKGFPIRR